jgi:hypothetical protein
MRKTLQDRAWGASLLAACATADAVAAGILVLGTPHQPAREGLIAAACHAMAVALMLCLARARSSRGWLFVGPVLAIPFAGVAVAVASFVVRGRGTLAAQRRTTAARSATLTLAAIQRLGNALSPSDALECGEEEQRRAALSALSHREDPEAIALLRRTAAGRRPDLALSAALILDDVGARAERRMDRLDHRGRA